MSVTAESFKALSNKEKGEAIQSWLYADANWRIDDSSWDRISKQILDFGNYVQTWKESDANCHECGTAQFQLWMRANDCKEFLLKPLNSDKKATRRKALENLMQQFSVKSQKEEGKKKD